MSRTTSTRAPFEDDELGGSPPKIEEIVSGSINAPELLQNLIGVQETRPYDEKELNQSSSTLKQYSMERIKTNRPPIKPIVFKNTETTQRNPEDLAKFSSTSNPETSNLLRVMSETNSPALIWHAYQQATRLSIPIPTLFLDRVSRVLARNYAPTRNIFLRLHEVLQVIRQQGQLKTWQWNSLIYHSALGLRKVHTKDYQVALDIFREMQSLQATPGNEEHCKPDIYTYTTLLSLAIRTGVAENVDYAYSLLRDSKLQQDRISRLAIIPYYIRNRNLKAVRAIAHEFAKNGGDMGIDGINAYIWAFGRHGQLNVVEEVYQALRSNLFWEGDKSNPATSMPVGTSPVVGKPVSTVARERFKSSKDAAYPYVEEWHSSLSEVDNLVFEFITVNPDADTSSGGSSQSESEPHNNRAAEQDQPRGFFRKRRRRQVNGDLIIMDDHIPNNITYTLCIQVHAYHNDIRRALQIFRDLITTPDMERSWGFTTQTHRDFHKAYRALFLGLVKYSSSLYSTDYLASDGDHREDERQWTEEALEFVFQSFLTMGPEELRPNDRTVGWIMQAFSNSSGQDPDKLIWAWRSLEQRFGPLRVPRLYRRLVSPLQAEEPDNPKL